MPVNFSASALARRLAAQCWPPRCLVCDEAGDGRSLRDLCPACEAALPWLETVCHQCALPLAAGEPASLCGQCLRQPLRHLAAVHASFRYAAPVSQLLPRLKFHQCLASARLLAQLMQQGLRTRPLPLLPHALVPVPLHRQRLRQRGYDQALELARPLARALGIPLRDNLLRRIRATSAQSRLGRSERRRNLRHAFCVREGASVPAHVTLFDDVMTTGATLEAAAQALHAAGACRVDAWVCARA